MYCGDYVAREIPESKEAYAKAIKEMILELLERNTPVFNTVEFIVRETPDGRMTVAIKWRTDD